MATILSITMFFRLLFTTLLWLRIAVVQAEFLSTGMKVKDFITQVNLANDATIFSKSQCPFCKATKFAFEEMTRTLSPMKITFEVIELDTLDSNDGRLIQDELFEITGQKTVPNVFVGGMPIGGNEQVQNMVKKGSLEKMIRGVKTAFDEDL